MRFVGLLAFLVVDTGVQDIWWSQVKKKHEECWKFRVSVCVCVVDLLVGIIFIEKCFKNLNK